MSTKGVEAIIAYIPLIIPVVFQSLGMLVCGAKGLEQGLDSGLVDGE